MSLEIKNKIYFSLQFQNIVSTSVKMHHLPSLFSNIQGKLAHNPNLPLECITVTVYNTQYFIKYPPYKVNRVKIDHSVYIKCQVCFCSLFICTWCLYPHPVLCFCWLVIIWWCLFIITRRWLLQVLWLFYDATVCGYDMQVWQYIMYDDL